MKIRLAIAVAAFLALFDIALGVDVTTGGPFPQNAQGICAKGTDGKCVAPLVATDGSPILPASSIAAVSAGETCVVTTAGGSTITVAAGGRWVEVQNNGIYPLWCTVDGTAPVAGTATRRVAALGSSPAVTDDTTPWVIPIQASALTLKCIAETATQLTGHCTAVTVFK